MGQSEQSATNHPPQHNDTQKVALVEEFKRHVLVERANMQRKEHLYTLLKIHQLYSKLKGQGVTKVHILQSDDHYMIVGVRYEDSDSTAIFDTAPAIKDIFNASGLNWHDLAANHADTATDNMAITIVTSELPAGKQYEDIVRDIPMIMPPEY